MNFSRLSFLISALTFVSGALSANESKQCSAIALTDWHDLVINDSTEYEAPLNTAIQSIFSPSPHAWVMADPMPWRRSMQQLIGGVHDAAMLVLKTAERDKLFNFVGPIGQFRVQYIKNIKAPKNNTLVTSSTFKNIKGHKQAVSKFDDVIWAGTNERAWRIFEQGRTEYALLPARETNMMRFAKVSEKYEMDPIPAINLPLYMMIRKSSHCMEDIPAIERAIEKGRLTLW